MKKYFTDLLSISTSTIVLAIYIYIIVAVLKNSSIIFDLLKKRIEGRLTPGDERLLNDLIHLDENEEIIKEILNKQIIEFNDKNVDNIDSLKFDNMYKTILKKIDNSCSVTVPKDSLFLSSSFRKILIAAVSIAALLVLAFLSGGLYVKSGDRIIKAEQIIISYSEIKAPYGSRSEVFLPDSTVVILNAGSSIRYSSDYNLNNRDLILKGEAYFKVARNNKIPLNVNAGNINVRAVGTEFNIKAYEDEQLIETTLVEGKVKISQFGTREDDEEVIDLIPNQKAIYIKETESFKLEETRDIDSLVTEPERTLFNNILISPKVDVNQVVAWTTGKLMFRGESLENLCIELQRKYDVAISFGDDEIRQYRFSGVLFDETLEQVLNVIKLTAPIKYTLTGKTVFLSSDPNLLIDYSKHLK